MKINEKIIYQKKKKEKSDNLCLEKPSTFYILKIFWSISCKFGQYSGVQYKSLHGKCCLQEAVEVIRVYGMYMFSWPVIELQKLENSKKEKTDKLMLLKLYCHNCDPKKNRDEKAKKTCVLRVSLLVFFLFFFCRIFFWYCLFCIFLYSFWIFFFQCFYCRFMMLK